MNKSITVDQILKEEIIKLAAETRVIIARIIPVFYYYMKYLKLRDSIIF